MSARRNPFMGARLYYHDESGRVSCGDHVGIQATYTPKAWTALPTWPEYFDPDTRATFRCDDPVCERAHGRSQIGGAA